MSSIDVIKFPEQGKGPLIKLRNYSEVYLIIYIVSTKHAIMRVLKGYIYMKKALILVVLLLAVFIGEMLMFEDNAQKEKTFVSVTSFPLYEITNKLIGEKIEVKKLIPFGVETHSYMPSVKSMTTISKAKLFIFNGLGIEPWIKKEYANQINMSEFIALNEIDEEHDGGHDHGDEGVDPHYWLDLENMMKMTLVLSEKLGSSFPEHRIMIEKNAQSYTHELKALQEIYNARLKSCARHEIVVNHNAFGYLAREYGFDVHSVTGLSPDEQVSAKKMKEITDLVQEEGIKTVFFESFISPKVAQTISEETGAQAESLQPLANITEAEADKGYILLMRENLDKLSAALECK